MERATSWAVPVWDAYRTTTSGAAATFPLPLARCALYATERLVWADKAYQGVYRSNCSLTFGISKFQWTLHATCQDTKHESFT